MDELVEIPINGVLDLHLFQPSDVKDLVGEYLSECLRRGIVNVRIIHGKGRGVLRRTVHAALSADPRVKSFGLASVDGGGWGATVVTLAGGGA